MKLTRGAWKLGWLNQLDLISLTDVGLEPDSAKTTNLISGTNVIKLIFENFADRITKMRPSTSAKQLNDSKACSFQTNPK